MVPRLKRSRSPGRYWRHHHGSMPPSPAAEGWCAWCCRAGEADARVGASSIFYTDGYNAYGEFTLLGAGQGPSLSPGTEMEEPPTLVHVLLDEQDSSTIMMFRVTGLGSAQDWAGFAGTLERIWGRVLNNLKAVLEA